jgi:hypothetical protein
MPGSKQLQALSLTQSTLPLDPGRPPRQVVEGLWLFAPNRRTQGGSSWWLQGDGPRGRPHLLVDAPAFNAANLQFLEAHGGDTVLVLTSREGHGETQRWQRQLGLQVLVQEQEAYLLPGVERLDTFAGSHAPAAGAQLLWTPGPTPGSCVLHVGAPALDVLFCGRLLVPVGPDVLAPLRTARTFHWRRQQSSLRRLCSWLPGGSPSWIATGAALGALRGEVLVPNGAELLRSLAWEGI